MAGGINIKVAFLRIVAFGLLCFSAFVAEDNNINKVISNTLTDPFWLGALIICLSWFISLLFGSEYFGNIKITHAAMTFFIITKVIAQVEHGGDYGPWGVVKTH